MAFVFGLPFVNVIGTGGLPAGVVAAHWLGPVLVSVTSSTSEAPFWSMTGIGMTLKLPGVRAGATAVFGGASKERLPVSVNPVVSSGARLMPIGSLMSPGAPAVLTLP